MSPSDQIASRITAAAPYQSTRLTITTAEAPRALQSRFEQAVPPAPDDELKTLVQRRASWPEVVDLITGKAPHGFLIYNKLDVTAGMGLAGHNDVCISYLMGNQVLAERMFRHEPAVLLYAPLHTVIWGPPEGPAHLTLDKPSGQFASFANTHITAVGRELDQKVIALLEHLGLDAPAELREL